jgi:signal transduction histidine kinase
MDEGGILLIRTRTDGRFCSISVSDTGNGIPDELLTRIFDPFFSTKGVGEGTGLGLTVSKAIVEQHKGELTVDSSEKGTTFTVRIPLP